MGTVGVHTMSVEYVNVAEGGQQSQAPEETPNDPLVKAAEKGDIREIEVQISKLSEKDRQLSLDAALCSAACNGQVRVIQCLVHHKADTNVHDEKFSTPLHCACLKEGSAEVVEALIEAKAELNRRTANGATALVLAVEAGDVQSVELLLQAQATVSIAYFQGASALHWAAQSGHLIITEDLLRAKADPNVGDSKGNTPLLLAVGKGRTQLTAMLLALGHADPDVSNSDGVCARALAKRGKLSEISSLIEANGSDLDRAMIPSPKLLEFQD